MRSQSQRRNKKMASQTKPVRCTVISPYFPDKCGIAIYTLKLLDRLKNYVNLTVIGNKTSEKTGFKQRQPKILRCWRRNSFIYFVEIWRTSLTVDADVIHIQFEFLAYGVRKYAVLFPLLLFFVRLLRKPILVTVHSVIPRKELTGSFFEAHGVGSRFASIKGILVLIVVKLIGYLSNAVVVHSDYMKTVLIRDYGARESDIKVVPHGVDNSLRKIDTIKAKRVLGLAGKKIILFFGFIIPGKGVEDLLDSFSEVSSELPEAVLIIAGSYHPRLYKENPTYVGSIEKKIGQLNLDGKIIFRNEFIPEGELSVFISAANVIALPYTDGSVVGASGVFSTCAHFSKPVIATKIPRFMEDVEHDVNGLLVNLGDRKRLTEEIIRLLSDDVLARRLGENLFLEAKERTWEKIALKTCSIYRELLKNCLV